MNNRYVIISGLPAAGKSRLGWPLLHRIALSSTAAGWPPCREKGQLFCHAPPEVLEERLKRRVASDRHPIHRDAMRPEQMAEEVRQLALMAAPLDLGVSTLSVETSRSTDEEAILAWVKKHLGADRPARTETARQDGVSR